MNSQDQQEQKISILDLPGYKTSIKEQSTKGITYKESNMKMDSDTGVVEEYEYKTVRKVQEGDFIKLYLEDICSLYKLQANQHTILYHLLKRMTYDGLIVVNKMIKEIVSEDTGRAISTIDNAITEYNKQGILIRKGRGVYLANPYLFGKGKFEDIQKIRMTLDYSAEGITIKSDLRKGVAAY